MTDRERGARVFTTLVRTLVCGLALLTVGATARAVEEPPHSAELDAMIVRQAKRHGVPESLVRRIVMRESKYNPRARNHLYWGLMQISYPTARSMGFKGSPSELLNPLVNLTYAVPYLANAFIIAGKRENEAVRLYASGYYTTARSRGLLSALRTADSVPMTPDQVAELQRAGAESAQAAATAEPPQPIAEQDAAAPLPEHRPAVMPEGKSGKGDSVDMIIGRKGDAAPPKKWTHDGGVTLVARGDQPIEQIAAYGKEPNSVAITGAPAKLVHGHMQKTTLFAAIYRPTTNAQAYAATSDGQDPRLAQVPSQAAIAEMASGQPAAAAPVQTADAEPAAKKKSHTRTARRTHARETTEVARADAADDEGSKHRPARHAEDAQAGQAAAQ